MKRVVPFIVLALLGGASDALLAQATGTRSGRQTIGTDLSTFSVTPSGTSTAQSMADATRPPFVNVKQPPYNAVGDGVADDTAAIQAAINATAHVFLPFGKYKITATLLIDDRQGMVIEGAGVRGTNNGGAFLGTLIQWAGNSTDPVIRVFGSAFTTIQGIKILASGSFPLDTAIRYETKATRVNTHNALRDVQIAGDGVLGTLHYGVQFIAGTGGDANNDQSTFDYLTLGGYDTAGVNITHGQSCDHRFFNLLMGSGLGAASVGIKSVSGASYSVYGGGGGGHSDADFEGIGSQFTPISIYDFHSENSARFFKSGSLSNTAGPVNLVGCAFLDSVSLAADGRVIDFSTQGPLNLVNFTSGFNTALTKKLHYDATGLDTYNFTVIGLDFFTTLTNPFDSFQPTFAAGIEVVGAGFNVMRSKWTSPDVTLTYGTTIATDAGLGNTFRIDVTNGTAFTISTPTNGVKGQRVLYFIRNISGGAMGAITWTGFKMAAFTNPANGSNRAIEFKFDGFTYYEINRATADVPN